MASIRSTNWWTCSWEHITWTWRGIPAIASRSYPGIHGRYEALFGMSLLVGTGTNRNDQCLGRRGHIGQHPPRSTFSTLLLPFINRINSFLLLREIILALRDVVELFVTSFSVSCCALGLTASFLCRIEPGSHGMGQLVDFCGTSQQTLDGTVVRLDTKRLSEFRAEP